MTPKELKDKFNQKSPNLQRYQLKTQEMQAFYQSIHRLRWVHLTACLGALISFFALFIEQEPGGLHAFQSIKLVLYASPGLIVFFLLMSVLFDTPSLYQKASFRWLMLTISPLLFAYELIFLASHIGILIHQGVWGWLPCHLFICFLSAYHALFFIGLPTPHEEARPRRP